ncbi:hypothetical protein NQZ68_011444 [Dissostichus eleginoides]|nr:hypothetical protein NQZ68_011444 [Dissostichus eleginoides]
MLSVDSESDDDDLLQPERDPDRCDSDYKLPPRESDGDEDEMASGPPPLSTFTQPTPASPSHSSTRMRSAPVLATQPASTFFYHFMDNAVVNSFLLHKELYKIRGDPSRTKPHTQKTFREQLAAEMLEYAEGFAPPPPPPPLTCGPMSYGEDASIRKYCRNCHDAGNKRVKTPWHCVKCQVPLCMTVKKNCYQEWHAKIL